MLTTLRRAATVIAASAVVIGTGAGAAFAFPSGQRPTDPGNGPALGPNHIEWTGQGSDAVSGNGSGGGCSAATEAEIGQQQDQPYLYWVFSPDGGSVTEDTANPSNPLNPVLHLSGGSADGQYPFSLDPSNAIKFVTPYTNPDPSTLNASVTMNILTDGGGAWTLKISHGCAPPNVVQAQAPTVKKDAAGAYTTTYQWNVKKTTSTPEIDTSPSTPAQASYEVVVSSTGSSNSDVTVSGDITISNPNSLPVSLSGTGNGISDQLSNGVSCNLANAPPSLPSGNTDVKYSCQVPASQFDPNNPPSNMVTVTWGDQMLDASHHLAAGNATYTVSNIQFTQNLVDNCVTPSDPQAPAGTFSQVCAGNAPQKFDYTVNYNTAGQPDTPGQCTDHQNTVTINADDSNNTQVGQDQADVKVCVGADLIVKKDATPSFTRTFTWGITKAVDNANINADGSPNSAVANYTVAVTHDQGTDSNWQVNGTIHVQNPNNWESVTLTGVTDAIDNNGGAPCKITSGDPNGTIAAGATVDLGYECDYAQAPSPLLGNNTATATWDHAAANTDNGSASGRAQADFNGLQPSKIVDGSVTVNDSQAGNLGTVSYTDPSPTLLTYKEDYSSDPAGQCTVHPNTATFTTSDTSTTGNASQSVTVCIGAPLQVSKTASPAFKRTYQWSISKTGDKTSLLDGGTVNYTVIASETGFTDSGWQVTGNITVTNPNHWEAIDATISDSIDNGGNCLVNGVANPVIHLIADAQAVLPYTCTFASNPGTNASGLNRAFAQWDSTAAHTQVSAAEGDAQYAFTNPTSTTDKTVTVSDPLGGGTLGTLTATDSQPFTSKAFNYSKTFSAASSGCATINNTATISTTPSQSSTFSVQNCTLGALTMGFWQNQNGQKIIGTVGAGSPLASYLTGFNPFKDYPQKSGQTVAQYFTAVFNAANAAGNGTPMLKAQMLATALDVYFWQQIGAPHNIGTTVVNVSPWAAAFGNPAGGTMTVNQMLSYASSQLVGTVWYGGSKTLVTSAIAAFNAVNNSTITGP